MKSPPATAPRVSVITATCNGAVWLAATVASVLAQDFADFEYIIVDDASTDASPVLAQQLAATDPRICLLLLSRNLGPAGALNAGLAVARGQYVAILDHDDLALPGRLALQLAFLDAHPAVGAVGGQAMEIDEAGLPTGRRLLYPAAPAEARWQLLFGASLLHSASMYRRALLLQLGGYSVLHNSLCDYELLIRLADVCALANLPQQLTAYRRSATQYSAVNGRYQNGQMVLLQFALHKRWLDLRPDLQHWSLLQGWMHRRVPASEAEAMAATVLLEQLFTRSVARCAGADQAAVRECCARRWLLLAHLAHPALKQAARHCWQRALVMDPELLRRPRSRELLRQYRRRRLP